MLSAIVLAAGDSARMGRPKALLQWRGRPFLEHVCDAARRAGIEDIVVVLGKDSHEILKAWTPADEKVTVNPHPEHGQLSSLRAGLGEISGTAEGVMVCLADQPTVDVETYRRLVETWTESKDSIIIPRVLKPGEGRLKRGHPIILPASCRPLCFEGPLEKGLHWVTHHPSVKVTDLEVKDAGIIQDFDTPEEYEALVRGR